MMIKRHGRMVVLVTTVYIMFPVPLLPSVTEHNLGQGSLALLPGPWEDGALAECKNGGSKGSL